jgi:regulator of sigma E protease
VHVLCQAGYFLLLLAALVLTHELGHFAVAKLCGIKVLRFSFGFGRRLFGYQGGETDYCFSAIPFGGYVKLLGEDPDDRVAQGDEGRTLYDKSLVKRAAVVLAGPLANLLLPVGIYFISFSGQRSLPAATIGTALPGLPADGLLAPGDHVQSVDGHPVRSWSELSDAIAARPGQTVRLQVQHGKERREVVLPVRAHRRPGGETVGIVGISPRTPLAAIAVFDASSPAGQAGLRTFDLITTVNTETVGSYAELERQLRRNRGAPMRLTYLRARAGLPFADVERLEPGAALLIPTRAPGGGPPETGIRPATLAVHDVAPASPLAQVGVRAGDELTLLDGEPIGSWERWDELVAEWPPQDHVLSWLAQGSPATPRQAGFRAVARHWIDEYGQAHEEAWVGARGRAMARAPAQIVIEHPTLRAARQAIARTVHIGVDMLRALGGMLRGRTGSDTLGGPLLVLQVAGIAADRGFAYFLDTLALISINIGLLNLLPIPALDGGHLLMSAIEAARRRPLSERVRSRAQTVGLGLVIALVLVALKNDLVRYLAR